MKHGKLEVVRGSGNVFRDLSRVNADADQFKAILAAEIIKVLDRDTLDVRFFERGVGFTMSSGTGSTGAFFAAFKRGLIAAPATVQTLAGPLAFRVERENVLMQGPAEIVARGEYFFNLEK